MNGSSRNAVASVVYSSLARERSMASLMICAWSNASGTPSSLPLAGDREVVDRPQPHVGRIGTGGRGFVLRGEPDVGDRHDAHAGIAAGSPVGAELFDVAERDRLAEAGDEHAGLLFELAARGAVEVVVGLDEPARERPRAAERMVAALHEQDREPPGPDGEQHDVDRHCDRRVAGRVVAGEERRFVARRPGRLLSGIPPFYST